MYARVRVCVCVQIPFTYFIQLHKQSLILFIRCRRTSQSYYAIRFFLLLLAINENNADCRGGGGGIIINF